ncbi:ribbon-helix-helix domain-containing protein [Streptomyces sp. RerS4]|uniref:ribbon-helix-helix domain-containing protein n=1 Tax=Streptomyces sp. RerS4 TaxID=2942449 RepID=UPI00201BC0BD|nr:ribbon-helix-helix domain-containing protein [Streptomyces sp. RerS4]UQX02317.1 ribbon-helix-helix domain-containing protein [Streptomyces sp. RerS4]
MATKKVTITLPEDVIEYIKERVDARGVSAFVTEAVENRIAADKLAELSGMLEEEFGPYSEEAYDAVLDRIAAMDAWHDAMRVGEYATRTEAREEAVAEPELPQERAA